MRRDDVRRHWEELASRHGTALTATTKTETIKRLEIAALERAMRAAGVDETTPARVLEVGCGNGRNCIALASRLPAASFTGVDYVPQMIDNARAALAAEATARSVTFEVGDILALDRQPVLRDDYDLVFTDRCLINLMSVEEQLEGLGQLAGKVGNGGHVIVLENTIQAFERQNDLREAGGLPRRRPPEHNLFIDEVLFLERARETLELVSVDEFAAMHDLILYVLVPMVNGGTLDYSHPLVEATTKLLLEKPGAGGMHGAGQNRLFVFRRVSASGS